MPSHCIVSGCVNKRTKSNRKSEEKYFFWNPRSEERRQIWLAATGKSLKSKFAICEDHFDMRNDVEFYKINGAPSLKPTAYPHRNLTQPEMALQSKIDKIDWKCFVPSCENRRLMEDSVVFFRVPEGLQGQQWKSAIFKDDSFWSLNEIQFCCEDHFDIKLDLTRYFRYGNSIEYRLKNGVIPSVNRMDPKNDIWKEVKPCRLADLCGHPRAILNNDISYLYADKFPLLIEKFQTDILTYVGVKNIKCEQIESEPTIAIKTEPMDTGYEYETNNEPLIKQEEESNFVSNPLDLEPKSDSESSESESESESSISKRNPDDYDPDVTTDDFSSTEEESSEASDESFDSEISVDDEDSDPDFRERFECPHCDQMVKNLNAHVRQSHWNFSKNVNRTRCGLCGKIFSQPKDFFRHRTSVHDGNAYGCDICGFLARTYTSIEKHIFIKHCSELSYRVLCQHCGIGFKFDYYLKRHMLKAHVERERTEACDRCEKKFFNASSLRKHVNSVHLNLRPHQCNDCKKSFKTKSYLANHRRHVHMKQDHHSCIICKKKFSFKGNLTVHMKNIHKT